MEEVEEEETRGLKLQISSSKFHLTVSSEMNLGDFLKRQKL